jgi:hypothetical protein
MRENSNNTLAEIKANIAQSKRECSVKAFEIRTGLAENKSKNQEIKRMGNVD